MVHTRLTLEIRHHRHVLVTLLKRRLVHAKTARRRHRTAALKAPFHRPVHHPGHLVPTQVQTPRHRRETRRAQPIDHQSLEQRRETRTRVRPRHPDRPHPVLRAPRPRHIRCQERPVLARRQMTPTATTCVVPLRVAAALWTTEGLHPAASDENPHLAGLKPTLDARHLPRTLDTQNPTVQVCVTHPTRLRHLHNQP